MILVTGVTGVVGREVARALGPRPEVRLLARRPERVDPDLGHGREIVRGDYADGELLARALSGVTSAFLVTNNPAQPDDERFVAAARTAGVRHLVKLSAYAVSAPASEADDFITARQRHNEEVVRASGLAWTFLRPRAFMSNTLAWASSIRAQGVVRALYGSAPHACVDPRDIAEVAVRALTEAGHEGRAHLLSGPEAITARQQAEQLGLALGRPLRFEELTPEQARAQYLRRYPEPVADALMRSAQRLRAGGKAHTENTVHRVTGRPARDFRTWAADHVDAFA